MAPKKPQPAEAPQEAPQAPQDTPIDPAALEAHAGALVGADGAPVDVPAGDLAAELAAGGSRLEVDPDSEIPGTLEEGGAPLELGTQLGGALPPRGDETPLPPAGPHTVAGPNGTITQVIP